MDEKELFNKISNLSIWKKGSQRAPHKPLLLLLSLAKLKQQSDRLNPYSDLRVPLTDLLINYGAPRKSYHPEEPFVRLTSDGIWEISREIDKKKFSDKSLLKEEVMGGFTEEVHKLLSSNPKLVNELVELLLNKHFPESLHGDILNEIGFEFTLNSSMRDSKFREKILRTYRYKCAVCGFNMHLGNNLIGLEAAHIKWHSFGGPDNEENGIALCVLHHKLFDRGAFTLNDNYLTLVADEANGFDGFNEWLLKFHGKQIYIPENPNHVPNHKFVKWHNNEVFRMPARYL